MKCVVYNRVSTQKQNSTDSLSLKVQESICNDYAQANNISIKSIYKEVHSAYSKIPTVLNTVINLKTRIILISDVSRFSRSINVGLRMAETALSNKNHLIFIKENLILTTNDDISKLSPLLQKTQDESKLLSDRITSTKKYLDSNNMYSGGTVAYGYKVDNKKVISNENEKSILQFILLCQQKNISGNDLNKLMIDISKLNIYENIICYDIDGNPTDTMTDSLTNTEIADLLNSYKVSKRGKDWNATLVKSAINSYDKGNKKRNIEDVDMAIINNPSNPSKIRKVSKPTFDFQEFKNMLDNC
jgi:DNA invertase Pin-like site-specific DNA recombinase